MIKILVPTDFSASSKVAVNTAIEIAKRADAQIIFLNIVEEAGEGSFNVEGVVASEMNWGERIFLKKLIEKGKKQLAEIVALASAANVTAKWEVRMGNAYHGIATIITEHEVDFVVMGTRGHSKAEEMLIGSVVEKVIRHSKCPVLTVHETSTIENIKEIVYATSLIKGEEKFAKAVQDIQKIFDARVHVVWINTLGRFQSDIAVRKALEEFTSRLKFQNFTINTFSDFSVEEGILHFADQMNAGMIAMSSHGRTGIAHLLVGSIAEEVTHHSKRPVMVSIVK
jgi:nucleotide-binding universal stress UspA family protein